MFPFIAIHTLARRAALPALLLAGLLGCSALPPPAEEDSNWARQRQALQALDSWQLRGRVNVRYDNESSTPRIQWAQQDVEYQIRLWGTFNAGNSLITGRPGFVTLEQDGEVRSASSPEDLILEYLGYEMPVSYLESWIKGIPVSGSPADLRFNELNQLTSLQQDGWTVLYSDMRQYGEMTLPRRVEVSHPRNDLRLRFIGLNWTLQDGAGG